MKEIKTELLIISVIILFSISGHILVNLFFLFLSIALTVYLLWNLFHLYQLFHIINTHKKITGSIPIGLWGSLYRKLRDRQNRWLVYRHNRRKIFSRFQQAFKHFPDGVIILNKTWDIRWHNSASKQLLNKNSGIINHSILQLIDHPILYEYIQAGLFDSPLEIESPVDRSSILSLNFIPLFKIDAAIVDNEYLLIIRDITRTYHLHQTRKDFIANVTHELKTPLTVFKGFLEPMCEDKDKFPAHWAQYIDLMDQQSNRMNEIINDLLLLSKLEMNGSFASEERIDMSELLNNAIENAKLLSATSEHQISIKIQENLTLKGETNSIKRIINNLLVNAIKYTPQRSNIIVSWYSLSDQAYLVVEDSGEGIAPRHLSRLTERFYRVESGRTREAGGSGLGLSIVNHALLCHQAKLKISSEIGRGSIFTCIFPKQRITF